MVVTELSKINLNFWVELRDFILRAVFNFCNPTELNLSVPLSLVVTLHLGVIPGYMAVTGQMAYNRALDKDIDKTGRQIRVGLDSSVCKATFIQGSQVHTPLLSVFLVFE